MAKAKTTKKKTTKKKSAPKKKVVTKKSVSKKSVTKKKGAGKKKPQRKRVVNKTVPKRVRSNLKGYSGASGYSYEQQKNYMQIKKYRYGKDKWESCVREKIMTNTSRKRRSKDRQVGKALAPKRGRPASIRTRVKRIMNKKR